LRVFYLLAHFTTVFLLLLFTQIHSFLSSWFLLLFLHLSLLLTQIHLHFIYQDLLSQSTNPFLNWMLYVICLWYLIIVSHLCPFRLKLFKDLFGLSKHEILRKDLELSVEADMADLFVKLDPWKLSLMRGTVCLFRASVGCCYLYFLLFFAILLFPIAE
jgi:hypothetical protein